MEMNCTTRKSLEVVSDKYLDNLEDGAIWQNAIRKGKQRIFQKNKKLNCISNLTWKVYILGILDPS